jgi:hypothetical protein
VTSPGRNGTTQEAVVDEARNLLRQLDLSRERHTDPYDRGMVARIDFAIGATMHLRALVKEHDDKSARS